MAATTEKPPGLTLDFLPSVDMTTLSQSELQTLSFCSSSSSSSDHFRSSDDITPTVDHSIFNESTGSHRQTYSRTSSHHHHHHHHHRHRQAGLLPKPPNPPSRSTRPNPASNNPAVDSDRRESLCIISFLKQFLSSHPEFQQLESVEFDSFSHLNLTSQVSSPMEIGGKKRKRGRKAKAKVEVLNVEEREREIEIGLEIVNRNGVAVDLAALEGLEDPYKEELCRRTEGMDKQEELLGFFRNLGGEWVSRRRKRKIVDACDFGDTLPVGWKLMLGLKRKEGRAWVYCRRYISPGGQHFVSCKEVSKYLQSFFGHYDAQQVRDYAGVNTEQYAGATRKKEDQRQSGEHEKTVSLLGIENLDLAEVQVHGLFECYKCNVTFDEKDTYLQHLLSFHKRTTRRYRIGPSVGDGVIIKDGKFECQFCHKVFDEKRRYNSHVGIHVRTNVKGNGESPADKMALQKRSDSPTNDELPARISRMDALIEIAQNSIQETSPGLDGETSGRFTSDQNVAPNPELLASVSGDELKTNSSPIRPYMAAGLQLHQQKVDDIIIDELTQKIDDSEIVLEDKIESSENERHGNEAVPHRGKECQTLCTAELCKSVIEPNTDTECHSLASLNSQKLSDNESNVELVFADKHDDCNSEDVDKSRCVEIDVDCGSNNSVADNNVKETLEQPLKEDGLSHGVPQLPMALMQSCPTFSANTVSLDEIDLSAMDKRDDKFTGFEDLKLEEIEQLKFNFKAEIEVPMNLVNNEIERVFDASVQFESDLTLDDAGGQQFSTLCIWCGIEFIHEAADTELQSDSVGYMCPACKEKISGPLTMWGGGYS